MGEIADALRRAHTERAETTRAEAPRETQDVYSESARRHEQEQSGAGVERPAAPASGAAAGQAEAVRLTHDGEEAHAPQGVLLDEGGAITDACLQLAMRVRKGLLDIEARTLVVTSAMRNEGKTTVSCNLALALASLGQIERVALVDLDLRRPSLARVLELPTPACGIEDVIGGGRPLQQARVRVSNPQLDVYPCRRGQLKAHELLLTPGFRATLDELRELYEIVVLDTPPTLIVPDATIIMEHADCFATVARAGITRARNLKRVLEILPRKRMLGAVLDGGATPLRKMYYDRYTPEAEEADDG